MNKTTLAALLGRPLTSTEDTNYDLYLKIAQSNLEDLLCTTVCKNSESRTYVSRVGYSTVFVDVFSDLYSVTVDGETAVKDTDFTVRQFDKRNSPFNNSLVFDSRFYTEKDIVIDASFGFDTMPKDLEMVLAGLFDLVTKKTDFDQSITHKRVEDFDINFDNSVDLDTAFQTKYLGTINKYSMCNIGYLRNERKC